MFGASRVNNSRHAGSSAGLLNRVSGETRPFNAGADATYIVWTNDSIRLGVGGFLRFTQASTDVEMLTTSQPTDVGGMQFGFGGRIRF